MRRSGIILVAVFLSGGSQFTGAGGSRGGGGGGTLPFTITVTPTNPTVAGLFNSNSQQKRAGAHSGINVTSSRLLIRNRQENAVVDSN